MKIEDLGAARRPAAAWEPFMGGLRARVRRERRLRVARRAAVAALALAALGGLWLLPHREPSSPSLRAHIPILSDPVFTPVAGSSVALAGGAVVVLTEART